jgi:hypothetical protein
VPSLPSIGVTETQSPSCSERTALPANATESSRSVDAPARRSCFTGKRLPSFSTAQPTTPSAAAAAAAPSATHSSSPCANRISAW